MKLFGRNDDERVDEISDGVQVAKVPVTSRLNEQCAKLREVHGELDEIEGRLTALRARQAATRLRDTAPAKRGQVETLDLRTLDAVDLTSAQLDSAAAESAAATADPAIHVPAMANVDDDGDDDFEKRFAAFAAGEGDESSRRWLDID